MPAGRGEGRPRPIDPQLTGPGRGGAGGGTPSEEKAGGLYGSGGALRGAFAGVRWRARGQGGPGREGDTAPGGNGPAPPFPQGRAAGGSGAGAGACRPACLYSSIAEPAI